jgi:uncharacterized protein (DUF1501 family)
MYTADALERFFTDMKRIGRGKDVAVMMFTEFGRRVEENQSGGTDHGAATPAYLLGEKVKPGLFSKYPSLEDLDANGDLKMTTDFRSVYATMLREWMGFADTKIVEISRRWVRSVKSKPKVKGQKSKVQARLRCAATRGTICESKHF